jgi:hypothetical protein
MIGLLPFKKPGLVLLAVLVSVCSRRWSKNPALMAFTYNVGFFREKKEEDPVAPISLATNIDLTPEIFISTTLKNHQENDNSKTAEHNICFIPYLKHTCKCMFHSLFHLHFVKKQRTSTIN